MAMANFTANSNQKSYEDNFCSTDLAKGRNNQLIFLIALNLFGSFAALLGNALILAALHKPSSLHPPSKLLFRNLATTDLAVGIIVQPVYVAYFISVLNEQRNICRLAFIISRITGYILCAVSILTLTAISGDRLLVLLLGLRYRQVVTLKRICVICVVFWCLCTIVSTMHFWSHYITLWGGYFIMLLCLICSIFSYAKIFFTLRHHQIHTQEELQEQQNRNVPPNRARYKKTVNSALWVQLALVGCYLPNAIVHIVVLQRGLSPSVLIAGFFTATLVFLNSSLNPILYCWKIREVRHAVKDIVKGLSCSSS